MFFLIILSFFQILLKLRTLLFLMLYNEYKKTKKTKDYK